MVANYENLRLLLNEKHLADLKASGLTLEQIRQTGHHSVDNAQSKQLTGYSLPGLAFHYTDPTGKPYLTSDQTPFVRLKPDYESKANPDDPKYLSPKGAGSRPYFSRLHPTWDKDVKAIKLPLWETEGEKKADKACAEGFLTISFAGVWGSVDRSSRPDEVQHQPAQLIEDPDDAEAANAAFKLEKSRQSPELEVINYKNRTVYQCYDSDVIHNNKVKQALEARARSLHEPGADPKVVLLPTELDGSKNGMDDFLVRHGAAALRLLAEFALPTLVKKKEDWFINPAISEPDILYKALMAWSVLKEHWTYRPAIGWYKWEGTHWKQRPEDEFNAVLTQFMDGQGWNTRTIGVVTPLARELKNRLLQREDDWNPSNRLVLHNGTLNFETDVFQPGHERLDFMTTCLPFAYDTQATCPTWLKFLDEALGSKQPLIDLLQAWMKYAIVPKDRNRKAEIEKALILIGRKGTGKGTFLDVLSKLIGEENIGPASPDTFKDNKSLASLLDKKVALDPDASGVLESPGHFNKVVSNELVPVRRLYKDGITIRLGVIIIQAMNKYISTASGSEGLDRRLCVVPFDHTPPVPDPLLSQKLEAELPGIFAWAWQLPIAVMKQRILCSGSIAEVQQASIERFEANNPEIRFLQEAYPDGADNIPAMAGLYAKYKAWCAQNNEKPTSPNALFPALVALGCKKSRNNQKSVLYEIPRMKDVDIAAHLGIANTVAVEGQAQGLVTAGASGACPELAPDISKSCPEDVPELPELLGLNSLEQNLESSLKAKEALTAILLKQGWIENLREAPKPYPVGNIKLRAEPPETSGSSGEELASPDFILPSADPARKVVAFYCKSNTKKVSAKSLDFPLPTTLNIKEPPSPQIPGQICVGMRVNKQYNKGWAGKVVKFFDDDSVEVLWDGETSSNLVKTSELKEDKRH